MRYQSESLSKFKFYLQPLIQFYPTQNGNYYPVLIWSTT